MMRTQPLPEIAAGTPWLEQFLMGGGEPVRTDVEQFPFIVGRGASCQLQVESTRVSREHAQISFAEDAYRVRDLGSINGVFLNGERRAESELRDGDLLVIADVEFRFFTGVGTMDDSPEVGRIRSLTPQSTGPNVSLSMDG